MRRNLALAQTWRLVCSRASILVSPAIHVAENKYIYTQRRNRKINGRADGAGLYSAMMGSQEACIPPVATNLLLESSLPGGEKQIYTQLKPRRREQRPSNDKDIKPRPV